MSFFPVSPNTLIFYSLSMSKLHFDGVYHKGNKIKTWSAEITIQCHMNFLGVWQTSELAACAYD
jgi:hypothetical protein